MNNIQDSTYPRDLDAKLNVSHLCAQMELPTGAIVKSGNAYQKIDRPEGIWPQGYGYYVEFAVKWKMGYRKYRFNGRAKNNHYATMLANGRPMTHDDAIFLNISPRQATAFKALLTQFTFDELLEKIDPPEVAVDDKYLYECDNLSHRSDLGAKADLMSATSIVDIKVCVKNEGKKWLKQCAIYAAMAYAKYGYNIQHIEAVNYLTGQSFVLDISNLPVKWQVTYITVLDQLISSTILRMGPSTDKITTATSLPTTPVRIATPKDNHPKTSPQRSKTSPPRTTTAHSEPFADDTDADCCCISIFASCMAGISKIISNIANCCSK